jgi:predicted transcriptional regulator
MLRSDLSADQALAAILLANQVAFKLGKRTTDESTIKEISQAIGKAQKTIQNTLTDMTKAGIVERSGKGSYRLTTAGTREVQETLNSLREGGNGNAGERVEPSS